MRVLCARSGMSPSPDDLNTSELVVFLWHHCVFWKFLYSFGTARALSFFLMCYLSGLLCYPLRLLFFRAMPLLVQENIPGKCYMAIAVDAKERITGNRLHHAMLLPDN